ncbi:hypothetical protein ACOMHN_040807 [Nucella lapillus]
MDTRGLLLFQILALTPPLTTSTTRYLPSSTSPWLSVSSSLYQPSPLTRPNRPHHRPESSSSLPSPSSSSSSHQEPTQSPQEKKNKNKKKKNKNKNPLPAKTTSNQASKTLQRDLSRLSRLLPGVYTNMQQYRREAGEEVSHRKRHMLLRSSFRPVTLRFLPRAFCVLVQDYSGDSLFPFRQRVYAFSADVAHRAIRMRVWNFATKRLEKKATQNLKVFPKLRRKDLVSQESCDMFWRRLDRTTFMGITGKQCLGYVKGEQVRRC